MDIQKLKGYRNTKMLLYNRVPKTGSETTMDILQNLAHENHFKCIREKPIAERLKYAYDQTKQTNEFVNMVLQTNQTWVYWAHFYFIDFARYHQIFYTYPLFTFN